MKRHKLAVVLGVIVMIGSMALAGCGGGGGGGGPSTQVTSLYLFGTMSSSSIISSVQTSVAVPNFVDYSAPSKTAKGIWPLRSGVLAAAGPVLATTVTGVYDNNPGVNKLTIVLVNGGFLNMSSSTLRNAGKGSVVATLTTKPGTTFPAADTAPLVGQQRTSPISTGYLNGCKVNYAP